jgi:hypothetical protein
MNEWWAYLHVNGTLQLKRYWGDPLDLQEAGESPFVSKYTQPFEAEGREDALEIARKLLGWNT